MARNGAGTYVLPAGQPVVTGTTISSATHNTLANDLANALTTSIATDGQSVVTANIPFAGYKLTGLGAATVNGDAVRYQDAGSFAQSQTFTAFTTGGTSTAYTLTPTPPITAYTAGQSFWVTFNAASGAAPTFAISGVATPPNLVRLAADGSYVNVGAGEIPLNYQGRVTLVSATQAVVDLPAVRRATRVDVASVAGTVDLTANAPNTDDIRITGALAITAFTVAVGRVIRVTAGGAFTLANNANIVTQSGATLTLVANDTFMLRATAANVVEVMGLSRPAPTSMVRLNTANGYGSTNTVIRRFGTVVTNQGADIVYADSATLGATFTIQTTGMYAISYSDQFSVSTEYAGISLNSNQLTTPIGTPITAAHVLAVDFTGTASRPACAAVTAYLQAGDVVRAHTGGNSSGTLTALSQFVISRVS